MKKLKKWREVLKSLDFNLHMLADYGFVQKDGYETWINRSERVVIKRNLFWDRQPTGFIPPTIFARKFIRGGFNGKNFYDRYTIQALCEIPSSLDRRIELTLRLREQISFDSDIHQGNVGYYRNKPVLFDW